MSQELVAQTAQQGQQLAAGRPGLPASVNAGAVSIESERAIAEARGQIQVAQMFPRDVAAARAELMDECDVFEFASVAFYAVPRGGSTITGPSIRLAEACASAYGHMEWGHRELSRGDGKSEVEVYAWDKQKNNRRIRQITVDHYRDTKNGPQKLRDSKDIDDKIANVASKQMRGAILALVPKSFVEAASARCRATLSGGNGVSLKQRIDKMTDAFARLGVTAELLKKHMGKPLSEINGDDIVDLTAVFNAIKGGDKIADHFGDEKDGDQAATAAAATVTATAKEATAKRNGPTAAKNEPKSTPVQKESNSVKDAGAATAVDTAKVEQEKSGSEASNAADTVEQAKAVEPEPTPDATPDPTPDPAPNGDLAPQEDDVF
jgi:hypothetical protein